MGHKPAKGETARIAAKERELKKILDGKDAPKVYADPSALFG